MAVSQVSIRKSRFCCVNTKIVLDDLGIPYFKKSPLYHFFYIFIYIYMYIYIYIDTYNSPKNIEALNFNGKLVIQLICSICWFTWGGYDSNSCL